MPQGTEDLYTGTSKLHREWGDLEATALALLTAKRLGEKVELPDWQHRWCIAQAQLKQSQGDLDGALDLLREAERVYVRTPVPEMRPIPAMKARLWVRQGKLVEALDWARERDLAVDDDLSYIREYEHATLARLLIAQHRSDPADGSIHDVMGFVERLLQAAEKGGRMGSVIEILVLQALACEAQGDISAALLSLERALTLAESEGYLRLFVDEGPRMARLLYEALSHGIAPEYVQRLLKAFPMPEPEQSGSKLMRVTDSEWVEPLSKRETEVLQLIAEGLTNQEIASTLYLSLNTVKVHTRNIYGKLDVHHRTSAVARARVLGLLPAT
jgi:LuxR family maltose regulon positive regulatory protein